jgi:hypothetical protein
MAAETTDILSLPYIMPSQAQKHVTHNEAIAALDALVQMVVADEAAAPPDTPAPGDRLIVSADASGAFAGQANAIAVYRDGGWAFLAPQAGWTAYDRTRQRVVVFSGENWEELPPPRALTDLQTAGINATADTGNRLAVASPASLFSHEGSDHRLKVNKAAAADTASLLFQSGYSGRAEMGLAGSDDFAVKVSADGTSWVDAMRIDGVTGKPSFPQGVAGLREVLAANRTYYVRTDGDDGNNGLANTAGGAFLTLQGAYNAIASKIDTAGYTVTVQIGAGTHAGGLIVSAPWAGGGPMVLIGDEATPANVVIGGSFTISATLPARLSLRGFKSTAGTTISHQGYGTVGFRNIEFAGFAALGHIQIFGKGTVLQEGDYSISGGGTNFHIYLTGGGYFDATKITKTVTLIDTPSFGVFVTAGMTSVAQYRSTTFAGSLTGKRYSTSANGVIDTGGAGANYFPGDMNGTVATGGQYT